VQLNSFLMRPIVTTVADALKQEILRVCRREIRQQVTATHKRSAVYRRDIAALKRQIVALQRGMATLSKTQSAPQARERTTDDRPLRFVAKGLSALRRRLDLSAPQFSKLMNVSAQTVYNWEHKKSVPRKNQLIQLAALRLIGKREAHDRLRSSAAVSVKKGRK
jgi:DNA-binding transcriptional regulator YiaG